MGHGVPRANPNGFPNMPGAGEVAFSAPANTGAEPFETGGSKGGPASRSGAPSIRGILSVRVGVYSH